MKRKINKFVSRRLKIINLKGAQKVAASAKRLNKKVVLVGGCFDILHPAHIKFLLKAKKEGDVLFVALEPDITVRKIKGKTRPVFKQKQRALVLAALQMVDYVVLLPQLKTDADYFNLTRTISPDVIAVTKGDPKIENKRKQAIAVGGRIAVVTRPTANNSTSQIIALLEKEL